MKFYTACPAAGRAGLEQGTNLHMRSIGNLRLVVGLVALAGCADETGDLASGILDSGTLDAGNTIRPDGSFPLGAVDAGPGGGGANGDGGAFTGDASLANHDGGVGSDAAALSDAGHSGDSGTLGSDGGTSASAGETGRMVGMTAAHNAVRAMVQTQPALGDYSWSQTLADYAQQWADTLAGNSATCNQPTHRTGADLKASGYGENLAAMTSPSVRGFFTTAKDAVNGWASEVKCYTFGTIAGTEQCPYSCYHGAPINSDGCGHYTAIIWRKTKQVGCGVANCQSSQGSRDIWICNYNPAGNYTGQTPY